MNISDVMTKDLAQLQPNDTIVQAAQKMKEMNIGDVLIAENNMLEGIITDRDIVIRCIASGMDANNTKASECMTKNLVTVSPQTKVIDASHIMSEHQIRRLPVTEDGQLVGIVTLGDLAVDAAEEADVEMTLEQVSEPTR
ncbi:MAG: CBS domain-containing protein [Actinobacteria bacterium]|nr:MAG: CBS domain-containing protein [Actinomycetota bacterium]